MQRNQIWINFNTRIKIFFLISVEDVFFYQKITVKKISFKLQTKLTFSVTTHVYMCEGQYKWKHWHNPISVVPFSL